MSAEWQVQAAESWKLSLPCTRDEAEALLGDMAPLAGHDPPPVVMTSEVDEADPDHWTIDVYVEGEPTDALVAALRMLAPSSAGLSPRRERLDDEDWVTRSQAFLAPLYAGRFYVHTAAHADTVPSGSVPFLIEASRAFGTGHHQTTSGCLVMLDRLAKAGRRFGTIADVGTGTGLLAFAAGALWPDARILASDIDPVAMQVARANAAANGIASDAIAMVACPGVEDPAFARLAPFDLLIANILAGPLVDLAADFARLVAPGGAVMLAGLLATQEDDLLHAFAGCGLDLEDRLIQGDWPTLLLSRRP